MTFSVTILTDTEFIRYCEDNHFTMDLPTLRPLYKVWCEAYKRGSECEQLAGK